MRPGRHSVPPGTVPPPLRKWPFGLVVGGVALGVGLASLLSFRLGGYVVGLALLLGAGLRLMLPERQAGLLVVRGRALDVATLAALGVAMLVATAVVPGGPVG